MSLYFENGEGATTLWREADGAWFGVRASFTPDGAVEALGMRVADDSEHSEPEPDAARTTTAKGCEWADEMDLPADWRAALFD